MIRHKCPVCVKPMPSSRWCDECKEMSRIGQELIGNGKEPQPFRDEIKEQLILRYMRRAEKGLPLFGTADERETRARRGHA